MRLGQGFNSFTQQICVDNAVVGISAREDSQPLSPTSYYIGKNDDVSIKALSTSNKTDIAADAHIALNIGAGEIKADAKVELAKSNLSKQSEEVAAKFPDLVAVCPQRTHAVLTKYDSLRTYLTWKAGKEISPLDYEIAQLYTSELLDAYMGYKAIWTDIHKKIQDLDAGVIELIKAPAPKSAVRGPKVFDEDSVKNKDGDKLKPTTSLDLVWKDGDQINTYEANFAGLDEALRMCRTLMVRIVSENDDVTKEPRLAIDKTRPVAYLRPQLFRQLIPMLPPAPSLSTPVYRFQATYAATKIVDMSPTLSWTEQSLIPTLVQGFTGIDLARSDGATTQRQVLDFSFERVTRSTATRSLMAPGGGSLYTTLVQILMVPINDESVLCGAWAMPTRKVDGVNPLSNVLVRETIKFEYLFEENPTRIVTWLAGFNVGGDGPVNISVKSDNVTTDSFDIVVRGSSDMITARVCWFAVPQEMGGVAMGSSETPWAVGLNEDAPKPDAPTTMSVQEHVRFMPKTFKAKPAVYEFISGFAFTKELKNIRLKSSIKDASKRGVNWQLSSWGDSQLIGASVSWLALEQ